MVMKNKKMRKGCCREFFRLNLTKLIFAIIILILSYFSNELLIVCKAGADCTPPPYSYLFGIIFLLDSLYLIIAIIYTIYIKTRGEK